MAGLLKYSGPYEYYSHKVRIGESDECWEWAGSFYRNGYGQWQHSFNGLHFAGNAHRRSFILFNGDPGDLKVCHRCGNRKCCNPNHLYAGTQKQNYLDSVRHGTAKNPPKQLGEKNYFSKLTKEEVVQIREHIRKKEKDLEIAKLYNVSKDCIYRIRTKKSWSWLQ